MLCGRDEERNRIGSLLNAARASRSAAIVLRGEPGVGKTALLEDTRERANDMQVLTARGVESESELPFAALHQLLRTAHPYLERLPEPQAEALRGALGLAETHATERFLVSAACLSLLSELSERRPVLCLIDDAHWLDTATADVLLFVARRLEAEGIVMIFAAREGDVRSFDAEGIPSLVVGGLDSEASATLLERGVGVTVAARVLDRLVQQTSGNALALLEVPAALTPDQLAGNEPLPEALPMTGRLEGIFLERVRRLPDETQRLLLVAAADDSEELGLVLAAAGQLGVQESALDGAEHSGLVSVHGTHLEFRHPLVRSAIYEAATSGERRAAHRALAAALGDEEQRDRRAWHLAGSALEADESIAQEVERVADRAKARGGYASAARALERAAELSADSRARTRRLVAAATSASVAGADDYAVALARQAAPLSESAAQRADVALVLGLTELRRGRPSDALPILMGAARGVASTDPGRAIELLVHSLSSASHTGDIASILEAARVADDLTLPAGDERSAILAALLQGFAADHAGDSARAVSILGQVLDKAAAAQDSYAVFIGSVGALVIGNDERYDTLLGRAIALARDRGEIGTLAEALSLRSAQLLMVQRFDEASHAAEEALRFGRDVHAENHMLMPRGVLASVAAFRGDDDDARSLANEVIDMSAAHGHNVRAALGHYALGIVDLCRSRWQDALERFAVVASVNTTHAMRVAADRIEVAVRAGRLDDAQSVMAAFESWAHETASAWAAPRVASCRALLADGDDATRRFEEALRLLSDARPFDRARIHLLYGEHLRRERRRAEAREQLRAAIEEFERFRAAPWIERAAAELRATGETARKRDPSTFDQLTPQEVHISRLVAQGMSNKEVAAQLFLSPRTVDYHLRNVFAKLGLTSRTQLVRMSLDEPQQITAESATG